MLEMLINTKFIDSGFFILYKLKINKIFLDRNMSDKLNTNYIILTYHETSREAFMDHMQYLDKKYNIISFEDFYYQFKKQRYPSDLTFVITFDDGRGSFYNEIFPVCEELSIPVMNYITTENVINLNPFWWDEVIEINKLGGNINIKSFSSMTSKERNNILDLSRYCVSEFRRVFWFCLFALEGCDSSYSQVD